MMEKLADGLGGKIFVLSPVLIGGAAALKKRVIG